MGMNCATDYHPIHAELALEYLDIVKRLKTQTNLGAVKGHLFKIMRPALNRETDLRDRMGSIRGGTWADSIAAYEAIAREMKERMEVRCTVLRPISLSFVQRDAAAAPKDLEPAFSGSIRLLPHWLAQPYFRPLPSTASASKIAA